MAIAIFIFLMLILFSIFFGISFLIFFLPTKWLVKTEKLKSTRLILSTFSVLLIISYYLFVPTWSNNKQAILEKVGNNYQITLTGERALMVHDPISALKRKTYTETFKLEIPRNEGVIDGKEIIKTSGYNLIGNLKINDNKLNIDLFYDNFDDKTKDKLSWNGDYNLKKIN